MNSSTPSYGMPIHINYHSAFYGTVVLLFAFAVSTPGRTSFADSEGQAHSRPVELLFADPRIHSAPGDRCEDEICARLLKLIQMAETSIDFAVYGMRNQTQLLEAIEAAQARGVVVRGVVDRDRNSKNYYTSTDLWIKKLGNTRDDYEAEQKLDQMGKRERFNRIMHNKFFVIDRRWVWTGSANISDTGTGGYNANIVAVVDSPQLAAIYTQEFEQMWSGRFHALKESNGVERFAIATTEVEVWFSPQDKAMRNGVQVLIAQAERRIDVAMFYLTNKYVTAELIAAHKRGVDVRVIVDATSAQSKYTKHELLREAGIPVKVENWGSKMHMKAAVVDGRAVAVGSMNWSFSGAKKNDENTLILHSPELAVEFESVFDRLWNSIPQKWSRPGANPSPESAQSSRACTDGIDNDFDKLIDEKDPGCSDNPPRMSGLPPHSN